MTAQEIIDDWNSRCPIGTRVSVKRDDGERQITTTRSVASADPGVPVVSLDGIAGYYPLDRVTPLPTPVPVSIHPLQLARMSDAELAEEIEGQTPGAIAAFPRETNERCIALLRKKFMGGGLDACEEAEYKQCVKVVYEWVRPTSVARRSYLLRQSSVVWPIPS